MSLPEVLIKPDLGKKAYRLKCRFTLPAYPMPDWIEKAKWKAAEMFVADMAKQGWEYDPNRLSLNVRGFRITGPYSKTPIMVLPTSIERQRLVAHRDLFRVRAGDRMRDKGSDYAKVLPMIEESDQWEYEISAVFIRNVILVETPDTHEELETIKNR